MKLEEAIRCNEDVLCYHREVLTKAQKEALQLGIEALKRIKDIRSPEVNYWGGLLPGETEE